MKMILVMFSAIMVGIGVYADQLAAPEEQLSRYFSRMEMVDGTNVLVKTIEWGSSVSSNGKRSQDGNGEEVVIPLGGRKPFWRDSYRGRVVVQTCLTDGSAEGGVGTDDGLTIVIKERYEDRQGVDIKIFPRAGKAYDSLAKRYMDFRLPFVGLWKNVEECAEYFDRKRHFEFSEAIKETSSNMVAHVRSFLAEDPTSMVNGEARTPWRFNIAPVHGATNMVVRLSKNGELKCISVDYRDGNGMFFVYNKGNLAWFLEFRSALESDKGKLSTILRFDNDGGLARSWYARQYMVVTNGVPGICMDAGQIQGYFKAAAAACADCQKDEL